MAVTITSPQSAVVARNSFTLTWTCTYPQQSYEIMYRKRGESAWSTFGRVYGTSKSVAVDCSKFEDFSEYQYRVIVYSAYDDSQATTYSGNDASAAYAVILVPASMVGTMKVKYGSGMIEVPLYSTVHEGPQIKIDSNKTTKLLDPTLTKNLGSSAGSKVKVRDNSGTKVMPGSYKTLSNPGVNSKTTITARSTYYTTYYSPAYYSYTPAYYSKYYSYTPGYYYYAMYDAVVTGMESVCYIERSNSGYNFYVFIKQPWLDTPLSWVSQRAYDSTYALVGAWLYNNTGNGEWYRYLSIMPSNNMASVYLLSYGANVYGKSYIYSTGETLYLYLHLPAQGEPYVNGMSAYIESAYIRRYTSPKYYYNTQLVTPAKYAYTAAYYKNTLKYRYYTV